MGEAWLKYKQTMSMGEGNPFSSIGSKVTEPLWDTSMQKVGTNYSTGGIGL